MTVQEAIQEAIKEASEDVPVQEAFKSALLCAGIKDDMILAACYHAAALGFRVGRIFEQNKKKMVER